MANTELVNYIKAARVRKLSDRQVFQVLKQSGWIESDIKEALIYVDMNDPNNLLGQKGPIKPTIIQSPNRSRWINLIALSLGYTWTLSGLNKVINPEFINGFSDYVKSQMSNSGVFPFYKNILNSLVVSNGAFFAHVVQYSELGIGILLLTLGFFSLFFHSRLVHTILVFVYAASAGMILNIILSSGIPFPLVNSDNIYASGAPVEYLILFLSIFAAVGHFSEAVQE